MSLFEWRVIVDVRNKDTGFAHFAVAVSVDAIIQPTTEHEEAELRAIGYEAAKKVQALIARRLNPPDNSNATRR